MKFDTDFVEDFSFDFGEYLISRFARNFGRGEDKAFITGTGINEPTGILHESEGAQVGITADTLTYDSVIELFFSVEPEYRKSAAWLVNDKTALALKKLKDADGNYLWNSNNDTILGKPVVISEFMPDAEVGSKPIAFGDFSYYWIVDRSKVSLRTLTEKFDTLDQIGYLAIKYLDGKLIRNEAVKVLTLVTEG